MTLTSHLALVTLTCAMSAFVRPSVCLLLNPLITMPMLIIHRCPLPSFFWRTLSTTMLLFFPLLFWRYPKCLVAAAIEFAFVTS